MRYAIAIILSILLPVICLAQPPNTAPDLQSLKPNQLTGVWEVAFGTSPDETIQTIRTKKLMTPTYRSLYEGGATLLYKNCLWEGRNYSMIELQYHDKHLCGGMLETEGGYLNYQSVTKSLQQQYGPPQSMDSNSTYWTFADQTDMRVFNDIKNGVTAILIHKEPLNILSFHDLSKQQGEDTVQLAAAAPVQKDLPGFWGLTFGQSPDTIIKIMKAGKKSTPYKRTTEGKATVLYYNDCMFGSDKCQDVRLTFYKGELCCGFFIIQCNADHLMEITKAMYHKYGPAGKPLGTGGYWNFEDGNALFIYMPDEGTAQITYFREKEMELLNKEVDKKQSR